MKRNIVFSLGFLSCLLFSAQAFALDYGSIEQGRQKYQANGCAACHGKAGHSTNPRFPILAGQHQDYLVKALKEYKAGDRASPIMQAQASKLSVADIWDITAFLSNQPTSLAVVPGVDPMVGPE